MSELPTPAVVPAGHVVRIRLGGHTYTSPIYSPTVAEATASDLARLFARVSTGTGFVDFTTADGTTVHIKARSVSAVEHGAPHPRKDHRRGDVINVFLDGGATVNAVDLVGLVRDADLLAGS